MYRKKSIWEHCLDDANEKGILIRYEIGRAEDIPIVEEKGEMKAKIAVANNSLKAGVSIDIIAEITGLSIDEIKQLKN